MTRKSGGGVQFGTSVRRPGVPGDFSASTALRTSLRWAGGGDVGPDAGDFAGGRSGVQSEAASGDDVDSSPVLAPAVLPIARCMSG